MGTDRELADVEVVIEYRLKDFPQKRLYLVPVATLAVNSLISLVMLVMNEYAVALVSCAVFLLLVLFFWGILSLRYYCKLTEQGVVLGNSFFKRKPIGWEAIESYRMDARLLRIRSRDGLEVTVPVGFQRAAIRRALDGHCVNCV